jgi:hypothetical protein
MPLTLALTCFYVHLTLLPLTGHSCEAYKKAAGKSHPDLHPVSCSALPPLIVQSIVRVWGAHWQD